MSAILSRSSAMRSCFSRHLSLRGLVRVTAQNMSRCAPNMSRCAPMPTNIPSIPSTMNIVAPLGALAKRFPFPLVCGGIVVLGGSLKAETRTQWGILNFSDRSKSASRINEESKQELTEEEKRRKGRFVLVQNSSLGFKEKALLLGLSLFGGLSVLAFPVIQYRRYKSWIGSMNIDGRKLRFTGTLMEFTGLYVWNWLLTLVTFGIYYFMGFAQQNIDVYVDEHIEWVNEETEATEQEISEQNEANN